MKLGELQHTCESESDAAKPWLLVPHCEFRQNQWRILESARLNIQSWLKVRVRANSPTVAQTVGESWQYYNLSKLAVIPGFSWICVIQYMNRDERGKQAGILISSSKQSQNDDIFAGRSTSFALLLHLFWLLSLRESHSENWQWCGMNEWQKIVYG